MNRETKKRILTLFILFAFLGSTITYALISAFPSENQVQANWRARIAIVVSEELQYIPANIGVTNATKDKLFTINPDGIIYKTGETDATLGDFFKIWGENFNSTCVMSYCNTNESSIRMYVNSKENFDYEYYKINNGDVILIDYR